MWQLFQITVLSRIPSKRYNSTLRWILDISETSLNAKFGIEDLSSFQSLLAHNLRYWDLFSSQPSDGFLYLRETWEVTRWEVDHLGLFFAFSSAGLVGLAPESLNRSNAPNTEKQM